MLWGIFTFARPFNDIPKYLLHTVKAGETLYHISKEYDVTVTDILNVNPSLGESNRLTPGQILRIPNKNKKKVLTSTPPSSNTLQPKTIPGKNSRYHTVEKGQTMYSISKMYNVKVEDIQKWNNLKDYNVKVGSQLIVNPNAKTTVQEPVTPVKQVLPEKKEEPVAPVVDTPAQASEDVEKPDIQASDNASQKELGKMYREKLSGNTVQSVRGTGAPMTTTLGAMKTTYFAMHKTLSIGTIIKIKNLVNSKVVYAKVIGKLPETDENKHVIVRYTLGVKKDLQLQNGKCYVQIEYPQ
jgi:LysM repeat protein